MLKTDLEKANLPNTPGVYFFMSGKEILYIGKATNLKSRVASYFTSDISQKRGPVIESMVAKAGSVDFKETKSALEALILEANLIKKHQPNYNSKEKSDKSFSYLIITKEDYPRLLIKREKDFLEGKVKEEIKKHFGPFSSRKNLEEAIKIVRRIFPFHSRKNSYEHKSEFYRQIGLAPGVGIRKEEYNENIKNIIDFFSSKKTKVIKNLKKKMQNLAEEEKFEEAAEQRKKISLLENINDFNITDDFDEKYYKKTFRIEAYDTAHMSGQNMVAVMTVLENGELEKNQYKKFNIKSFRGINDPKALEEVLARRFKHSEWSFPDVIVVDGNLIQKRAAEKIIRKENIENIKVVACVKNKSHKVERIIGERALLEKHAKDFVKANSEAHRFSLKSHIQKRAKNFL